MSEKEKQLYTELAPKLVTPERYGAVALAPLIQLPLPELARVYNFPLLPGELGG